MTSALTPWAILTASAILTAFHIGLYTLVGRERKSPYLINSVFPIFLLSLITAILAVLSTLSRQSYQEYMLKVSAVILVFAFIYSFITVFRITTRFIYYVDSVSLKHLPIVRHIRRLPKMLSSKPNYAHDPIQIPEELSKDILTTLKKYNCYKFEAQEEDLKSLAVAINHQNQCNQLLSELSLLFLKKDYTVQYLTSCRHPSEFITYFKAHIEKSKETWATYSNNIVVIDAYSAHFGFIDSIYGKKTKALAGAGVHCETSKMTYAGIHSASSRAFNIIQNQVGGKKPTRKPTLVIYEGTYALSDLESPEQYRIFLRHVLPSERMWGGMFSVFIESSQPTNDWVMLNSYASLSLDMREKVLHKNEC